MKLKMFFICFIITAVFNQNSSAKVEIPDIIGDNMVLQQNSTVKLWGRAKSNSEVVIKVSWNKQSFKTISEKNGNWVIKIRTPNGSYAPQQIDISDGESLKLHNILIGEVWLCSGQSNMEMPLRGYPNSPVANGNETIAASSQYRNKIHFVSIPWTEAITPQEKCQGKWKEANPENSQWFSAIGYHFAVTLNLALDIPVGIISCSWGGSTLEGWLPEEILKNYSDIDLSKAKEKKGMQCLRPMIMYNGMLYPIHNYTIRGFLWYQGESNVDKYNIYSDRLGTLMRLWRNLWELGDIPFYYTDIAPYNYASTLDAARFREAQYRTQLTISNCGMICTNDLVETYERTNIHPKNKSEVGKRFAFMALAETYHIKGIQCRGPEYESMQIKNSSVILSFKYADDGFSRLEGIEGFEIAGLDRKFFPAIAEVLYEEKKIKVYSNNVLLPVAVRYCFHNFMIGNIKNNRELPLIPFRTDNW